ncbi:unnamed protein product [Musa textilis]
MMLYMYIWFVILCRLYFALFNALIAVCDILFIILICMIYLDAFFCLFRIILLSIVAKCYCYKIFRRHKTMTSNTCPTFEQAVDLRLIFCCLLAFQTMIKC